MKTLLLVGRGVLTAPWARRYAPIRAPLYSENTERGCVVLDQRQQAADTEWLGARHALRLVFDTAALRFHPSGRTPIHRDFPQQGERERFAQFDFCFGSGPGGTSHSRSCRITRTKKLCNLPPQTQ